MAKPKKPQTMGLYAGANHPSRKKGSFIRRLWPAQAAPIDELKTGEVILQAIPAALVKAGELSHTRWNGEKVIVDRSRAKKTAELKAARKKAQADEEKAALSAWDKLTAKLSPEEKDALSARLGFE